MELDRDLLSRQQTRRLIERAAQAAEELKHFDQTKIDRIVAAIAEAGEKNAENLARMACEETGFGNVEDKTTKNLFASRRVFEAIRDMKKFIGPDTIILSVLNGITSEEDIEAVYPGHCLWSVAIGMDATRVGRSLTFGAPGRIQFGEKNGEMTDRVRAVDEYLTACGIASEPCSDILFKQWSKLMVNDGLNQAAAAFDLPYGGLTKPGPAYDKMLEAMQEVIDLSVLEGVNLPADNHKAFLESMAPTFKPDGMPSMRQDVLAQRPTEVEEFAGVVRRLAKKHGMPTPANDFFYEKIREIEAGYHKE